MRPFLRFPARLRGPAALVVLALLGTAAVALPAAPAQAKEPVGGQVSGWIPGWDQARAMATLTEHADLFSYASPFWYVMRPDGGIGRYSGAEDSRVLSGLRAAGVPVVPTITNAFDPVRTSAVLGSATSRSAHVRDVVDLVLAHGYDGIDVDYESMAAADRDRFSAFLAELAAQLRPHGRLLTVAVHAKTSEPGTWSGPQAHDYAAIGAVADRVRVMAYGHAWSAGPAGPIAPLPWVSAVAAFAASRVPAHKVELGLHLYGHDWPSGGTGTSPLWVETDSRLRSTSAVRLWDPVAAEPFFSYDSSGTRHTVHYADAQSVAARLALVDDLGLAGAAFWRLGGEDPAVWDAVRSRLAATPDPVLAPVPVPADTSGTPRRSVGLGQARERALRHAAARRR